jgi:hypothetical protein
VRTVKRQEEEKKEIKKGRKQEKEKKENVLNFEIFGKKNKR